MYSNIGKKIKALAIIMFILMAVGCVAAGIIFIVTADDVGDVLPYALPILIAGPVFAWISSWFIYGVGELICKATEIARNTAAGYCVPAAAEAPAAGEPQPQAPAHSVEFQQRLAKLQALCNQGIITDEEYDVALAKLRAEEQK
jgi:hypothetical protein